MVYGIFHNSPMKTPETSDSITGVQTTFNMCISGRLRCSRLAKKVVSLLITLLLFLLCSDAASNCSAGAPIHFASCKSHTQKVIVMLLHIPFIKPLRYTQTYRSSAQTRSKQRMLHANLHDTSPDGGSERLCFKLLDVLNPVARLHHLLLELRLLRVLSRCIFRRYNCCL